MKKFLTVLFILFSTCAVSAQNLPTKWTCRVSGGTEAEKQMCVNLHDKLVSSGYADMIAKDEYPAVWFQIDVVVQEIPEREAIAMSTIVMMAYPAKLAQMYIAVYTQLTSVGTEAVDKDAIYEVIVQDIKRDTGAWAESLGAFIEFLPPSGLEWFKKQGELDAPSS
jgi:hypothetical protein